MTFKDARKFLLKLLNSDLKDYKPYINKIHKESDYPPALENPELIDELAKAQIEFSLDFDDRFFRCRGQATRDFYVLRFGKFERIPDLVVWPKTHDEVISVVKLANKYCSCIIPLGGATNITQSLTYSKKSGKNRFFISLDTSMMNKILWIDRTSMLACIESGIAGKDLEDALYSQGLTMGHEPDSIEFSTLGGWIATRSSGMKQQTYGNIEDIVVKSTLVTSSGVIEKNFLTPRSSIGPDYDQIILGSEGTLGVITKAVVKVHNSPEERRYGSIMFPDFERGLNFMYEVSKMNPKPSNLRLIDSIHFNLGQALKINENVMGEIADFFKTQLVTKMCRFNLDQVSLATYLIEGNLETVEAIEKKLKEISIKYLGVIGGPKYGKRAYMMTFAVCYIRVSIFY
jgi:alkyldihydroxyacetonephosphate synthase